MKKFISITLVVFMALSLFAVGVFAADQEQTQDQLRIQDPLCDPDQDRLQTRDRLQLLDSVVTQQQLRLQDRDQTKAQFPDCENHWANNQVTSCWSYGLIEGYPDGNFGPNKNVSGIEGLLFTTRLMNCLNGLEAGDVTPGSVDWTGVPNWAQVQLQEQNASRLMTQTNYYLDANMNRVHVAVMLAKGLELEPVPVTTQTQLQFKDQNQMSDEDLGYVLRLKNLGIVSGYPDGTFQPNGNVTRAEICTMMEKVLDLLK